MSPGSIHRTSRPSASPPRPQNSLSNWVVRIAQQAFVRCCRAPWPRGAGYSAGMVIPSAGSHGLPPRLLPLPIPFRDQTQSWQRAAFNVLRMAMFSNIFI